MQSKSAVFMNSNSFENEKHIDVWSLGEKFLGEKF